MVGMAKRGHIDDRDLAEFFRAQDGLPQIGDVELLAVGGESESKWTFPFEEDSVINLLSVLRQEWSQAQAQSTWRDDPGNARFLVEPWLMVSPAVPHGILEFIASDPACPAVTLAAKYAELPAHLEKIIKGGERGSIPDVWELKGNATGSSRLKAQKKKSATKSDLVGATDPAAASLRDEVNVLLDRILEVVPRPTEDADEDSLEGLVGRHMQFLQATGWMLGAVEMPARTIRAWRSALATLAETLEDGDDDAVAEAAYNSWLQFGK